MSHFIRIGKLIVDTRGVAYIGFSLPNENDDEHATSLTILCEAKRGLYGKCTLAEYDSFIDKFFTMRERQNFIIRPDCVIDIAKIIAVEFDDLLTHFYEPTLRFSLHNVSRDSLDIKGTEKEYNDICDRILSFRSTSEMEEVIGLLDSLVYAPAGAMAKQIESSFLAKAATAPTAAADPEAITAAPTASKDRAIDDKTL